MFKTYRTEYDLNDPGIISVIDDLPLWSAPFGLKLLDEVKYRKNIKVLDVGSGNGFPSVELAARLGHTSKVFGIDPWNAANTRVRQKIDKWGITNLKIIEGVSENLPFDASYFDLIVSNNGINNVQDEEKVWSEISRVAKPGSQFVFTVNLPESFIEFYDLFRAVLEKDNLYRELEKVEEHIYAKRKPVEHFLTLIEKNGFHPAKIIEDSFNLTYADGRSMLNHFFINLAFRESWEYILEPNMVSDIFGKLVKILDEYSENRGCLKLTVPYVCIDTIRNG